MWQNLRLTEADVPTCFNGVGNVGVILGKASDGLTDCDLDCREAVELAPKVLPETGTVDGLASPDLIISIASADRRRR